MSKQNKRKIFLIIKKQNALTYKLFRLAIGVGIAPGISAGLTCAKEEVGADCIKGIEVSDGIVD